jgi:hypothetical protein
MAAGNARGAVQTLRQEWGKANRTIYFSVRASEETRVIAGRLVERLSDAR